MLENLLGRIPANLIVACAILSLLLPYGIYKFNGFLHKKGDPPWKKEMDPKNKTEKIPGEQKGQEGKGTPN